MTSLGEDDNIKMAVTYRIAAVLSVAIQKANYEMTAECYPVLREKEGWEDASLKDDLEYWRSFPYVGHSV